MTDIANANVKMGGYRVLIIGAPLAKAIIEFGSEYEKTENKGLAAELANNSKEIAYHARLTHCLIGLLTEIPECANATTIINHLEELGDICYYTALGLHILRLSGLQEQAIVLALRNLPLRSLDMGSVDFQEAVITTIDLVVKKGFICGKYTLAEGQLASLNTFMQAIAFVLLRLPTNISLEELLEAEQHKVFAHNKLLSTVADPMEKFAALAERVG